MNDVCRDDKRPGVTSFSILVDTPSLVKSAVWCPGADMAIAPNYYNFGPKVEQRAIYVGHLIGLISVTIRLINPK